MRLTRNRNFLLAPPYCTYYATRWYNSGVRPRWNHFMEAMIEIIGFHSGSPRDFPRDVPREPTVCHGTLWVIPIVPARSHGKTTGFHDTRYTVAWLPAGTPRKNSPGVPRDFACIVPWGLTGPHDTPRDVLRDINHFT